MSQAEEGKKRDNGSLELPLSPRTPKIQVELSCCRGGSSNHDSTPNIKVLAGLDTYSTHSLIPLTVLSRLFPRDELPQFTPPYAGAALTYLDGSTTSIIGFVDINVLHQSVRTVVRFLVVHTVSNTLGIEVLLGTDYMSQRGDKMVLSFGKDRPIQTTFLSAAVVSAQAETLDGGDFSLHRRPNGSWEVCWQWKGDPPDGLYKGVSIYTSKLRKPRLKELFEAEVEKWIQKGYILPYSTEKYGRPRCTLTWNPVIQLHKSTPVRPTFDYKILNPYIKCRQSVSQSEICHESVRLWRKFKIALLVDIEKAYMNIHIADQLLPFQTVRYKGTEWVMTRMAFGLNVAPRALKLLISHILRAEPLDDTVKPYMDDILIGATTDTGSDRDHIKTTAETIRAALLAHGLPTKPPVDLYDFSKGNTRALGLELLQRRGEVYWKRRSDVVTELPPGPFSFKDVASYVGTVAPANYPVQGRIRPICLHILSANGKEVHLNKGNWNITASTTLVSKIRYLSETLTELDSITGKWFIPETNRWVLATDASTQAQGCAVMTEEAWLSNPDADCVPIEDHCWLNKSRRAHINLFELEAIINGFKILRGYSKPGDSVKLLLDSKVVHGWTKQLLNDQKVVVSGLYEVLVLRRLEIIAELIKDYHVEVNWIPSERNPADRLTRYPPEWDREHDTPISCAMTDVFIERVKESQLDSGVQQLIRKLDENGLLYFVDGVAYKRNEDHTLSVIISEHMIDDCIKKVHDDLAHAGWKPTWIKFKRSFYAPVKGLAKKVQAVCKFCAICMVKNAKVQKNAVGYHSDRLLPWHEVFIDTVQISSAMESKPHLLIVCIDNFTKFVEAYPVSDKRAETVRNCLSDLFARYGTARIVRADNGSEYSNEVVLTFLNERGCHLNLGATRNPQSQASVERVHRTLLSILRSLLFNSSKHWTEVLPDAVDAYRSRPHGSLGMRSPREALFGWCDGPVAEGYSQDEFTLPIFADIEEEQTPYEDQGPIFSSGEEVMIATDPRRAVKTAFQFTQGVVIRYLGRGTYLLADESGNLRKFNQKVLAPRPRATIEPVSRPRATSNPVRQDDSSRTVAENNIEQGEISLRRSTRNRRPPIWFQS